MYNYDVYGNNFDLGIFYDMMASMWVVILGLSLFCIVCWWKLFVKAGKPGWGAIVPVYNVILMLDVAEMSWKWILTPFLSIFAFMFGVIAGMFLDTPILFLIGFIIFVFLLISYYIAFAFLLPFRVARNFGKGDGFAVLTVFFAPICYAILAFGSSSYVNAKFNPVLNQNYNSENNFQNDMQNSQVVTTYCPFCGSPVYGESKFCSNCGSNVN